MNGQSLDEFTAARIKRHADRARDIPPPWAAHYTIVDKDRENECAIYLFAVALFDALVAHEATVHGGLLIGALLGAAMIGALLYVVPYLRRYVRHKRPEDVFQRWQR